MNKAYFHLLIILTMAWVLYGLCQNDAILPGAVIAIAFLSFLLRLRTGEKQYAFFARLPLAVILLVSLIAGILWRIVTPAPQAASAIYIGIFSVWQSSAVVASLIIWLMPFTMKNIAWLTAASWVIASLSTNVPFDDTELLVFRLFCIFSLVNILIHTLKKPMKKERVILHYRQLLVFGLVSVVITGIFFRNIVWGLRVFDQVFMSLVGDYLLPRDYTHFLNISPFLQLTNPGASAMDKRPVLEIDSHGYPSVYLRMQAFETYENGTWGEIEDLKREKIGGGIAPGLLQSRILMYRAIDDIIPTIYGTTAVNGNDEFTKDPNHIFYAKEKQRMRVVLMGSHPDYPAVDQESLDLQALTEVPALLKPVLDEITAEAVLAEGSNFEKAKALEEYLRKNFRYTLNVNFHANDEGMLEMLRDRKPAYCSYFATALTLLLRSEGIPARVATGFMSQQRIGSRGERILVRVRNAHAWSEVLLTLKEAKTGRPYSAWVPFDGTPPMGVEAAINSVSFVNMLADRIWLATLRTALLVQSIDKDKLKTATLLLLVGILFAINLKRILSRLLPLKAARRKRRVLTDARYAEAEALYRRYEEFIRLRFSEKRLEEETDTELLRKLQSRGTPKDVLYKLHDFIDAYRDVRFGGRTNAALKDRFNKLQAEIR